MSVNVSDFLSPLSTRARARPFLIESGGDISNVGLKKGVWIKIENH